MFIETLEIEISIKLFCYQNPNNTKEVIFIVFFPNLNHVPIHQILLSPIIQNISGIIANIVKLNLI